VSRILVLNQYYPPDTSATALMAREVVEALAGAGHQVTVLAGRPSYDPTERRAWRPLLRERVATPSRVDTATARGAGRAGTITVERVGSTAFDRRRMAGRASNYLSYLSLAVLRAPWVRCDAIVTMTDPPFVAVLGALAAGLRRVPFVYNIRDLHPDWTLAAGLLRPGPAVRLWEALHRWALVRAARVIVLGDDMRDRVTAKGVDPGRVRVVRDGASVPDAPPGRERAIAHAVRGDASFVVMHAGNLGFTGAWETLGRAARALAGRGVSLVFVGGGAGEARVRAALDGTANVRFLPFRPAHEVPALLAAADLQIVTVRRGLEGLVVPSKLYGILAAGRAVLVVASEASDAARIVTRRCAGWVADPDDPSAVAAAIGEAMENPAECRRRAGNAFAAAGEFERGALLGALVREVEGVGERGRVVRGSRD